MHASKSDSARINGAKSRGPKTEAGRARSSQNALKHGLTSQTLVLPSEDPADYDALLTGYLDHLQPIGLVELDLVHEIVAAKWRLNRIALIETRLFTETIEDLEDRSPRSLTPVQALTGAFERLANHNSLTVLHRMESRLVRSYSRALRDLLQLQRLRDQPNGALPNPSPDENEICKNEPNIPPPTNGYLADSVETRPATLASNNRVTGDASRNQISRNRRCSDSRLVGSADTGPGRCHPAPGVAIHA